MISNKSQTVKNIVQYAYEKKDVFVKIVKTNGAVHTSTVMNLFVTPNINVPLNTDSILNY